MCLAGLFLLVARGMPVAFALLATSLLGVWLARGNMTVAENGLGIAMSGAARSFEFGVVPLFVTMGLVLDRADVGRDAFRVAVVLNRRARRGDGAGQRDLRGDHRIVHRVRRRVQPRRSARDGGGGIQARLLDRPYRREFGAGHAGSAEHPADHLRISRRGLRGRAVSRGGGAGPDPGDGLRAHQRRHGEVGTGHRRRAETDIGGRGHGHRSDDLAAGADRVPDRPGDGRHLWRVLQPDGGGRHRSAGRLSDRPGAAQARLAHPEVARAGDGVRHGLDPVSDRGGEPLRADAGALDNSDAGDAFPLGIRPESHRFHADVRGSAHPAGDDPRFRVECW